MFTVKQFTIDSNLTRVLRGSESSMRRAMTRAADLAIAHGLAIHLLLINPQGQVVETV